MLFLPYWKFVCITFIDYYSDIILLNLIVPPIVAAITNILKKVKIIFNISKIYELTYINSTVSL